VKFKVGRLMKEQLHGLPDQPLEVVVVAKPSARKTTRRTPAENSPPL
jgi:hypothetical protein